MHRSFTNLPLLALLGAALACIGCRTQQADRHVNVSPGPVMFSRQAESRLGGPLGSEPQENTAQKAAGGESSPAEKPAVQTAATESEPAKSDPSAPAPGATASLSDTPSPADGNGQLSDEERAALAEGFRDADPEVRDLANRLAALEVPQGDAPANAANEGSDDAPEETSAETSSVGSTGAESADDDQGLPTLDDSNGAEAAGEGPTEGVDIRRAVGEAENVAASKVKQAAATKSDTDPASKPAEADAKVAALKAAAAEASDEDPLAKMTDEQIFSHLIGRYQKRAVAEPEGELAASDLIALRTLMVLSGNPDGAVAPIDGWKSAEQEFLSYQMLTLWQLVDPQAHPVRARRWTTALPELRQATNYLAASTDTLDVRSLAWCTEVTLYDVITPFPSDRFVAGQEAILYSEVDNFGVERLSDGVESHMQGTYEVIDTATGKNVATMVGEVNRQKHNKTPRDYFLAYIITFPQDLRPGRYKLQLTVEDFKSGKYGRSSIPFEIVAAR